MRLMLALLLIVGWASLSFSTQSALGAPLVVCDGSPQAVDLLDRMPALRPPLSGAACCGREPR